MESVTRDATTDSPEADTDPVASKGMMPFFRTRTTTSRALAKSTVFDTEVEVAVSSMNGTYAESVPA